MKFGIDILEDDLLALGKGILETLLKDRTTDRNIIWATNDYEKIYGEGYGFSDTIEVCQITGDEKHHIIQPRIQKALDQQRNRSRDMAEVFTPSWICNAQNNLIDDAWFGQSGVFNREINEGNFHSWESFKVPQIPKGKKWRKYVSDTRLEMACGEAPYLVSRYDATTGAPISIGKRIGMLDRKMWVINNNTPNVNESMTRNEKKNIHKVWSRAAYQAYQSTYGFEWQGDNLLLAREALFVSFIEYYQAKWDTEDLPQLSCLQKIAEIISWNIWQMDGLKYGIPGNDPAEYLPEEGDLNIGLLPEKRYCRVKEWKDHEPLNGNDVIFKTLLYDNKKK